MGRYANLTGKHWALTRRTCAQVLPLEPVKPNAFPIDYHTLTLPNAALCRQLKVTSAIITLGLMERSARFGWQ